MTGGVTRLFAAMLVAAAQAVQAAEVPALTRVSQELGRQGVKLTVESNPFASDRRLESLPQAQELGERIVKALEGSPSLQSGGLGRGVTEVRVAVAPQATAIEEGTRITFFINPLSQAPGLNEAQVTGVLSGGARAGASGDAQGSNPAVRRSWERIGEIREGFQTRPDFDGGVRRDQTPPVQASNKPNEQLGVVFLGGAVSRPEGGVSGGGGSFYVSIKPPATKILEFQPGYGFYASKATDEKVAEELGVKGEYDWVWRVTDYNNTKSQFHDFGRVLLAPRIGPVTPYAGVGFGVTRQNVTTGKLDEFHVFKGETLVDRDDYRDETTKSQTKASAFLTAGARIAVSQAVSVMVDYAKPPLLGKRISFGVGFTWK